MIGTRSATPAYVTCGNLTTKAMNQANGISLVGCLPQMAYSNLELHELLKSTPGLDKQKKGKRKEIIKNIKQDLRNKFLARLFKFVTDAKKKGPLKLQIGRGNF
jgi:hypothetical protein